MTAKAIGIKVKLFTIIKISHSRNFVLEYKFQF